MNCRLRWRIAPRTRLLQDGLRGPPRDRETGREGRAMRRFVVIIAALTATVVLAAGFASSAGAYGGGAGHDMWQIGFSGNCNNQSFCGDELGGFWGWVEFDRFADGTITGDAQTAFCFHTLSGGGAGGCHAD